VNQQLGQQDSEQPASAGPFGVPTAGDFYCGRCGTLLDGGTDEPVTTRDLRAAAKAVIEAYMSGNEMGPALAVLEIAADFKQQGSA
jgi:hypothetical protein